MTGYRPNVLHRSHASGTVSTVSTGGALRRSPDIQLSRNSIATRGGDDHMLRRSLYHLKVDNQPRVAVDLGIESVIAPGRLPLSPPETGGVDDRWRSRGHEGQALLTNTPLHHLDASGWGIG